MCPLCAQTRLESLLLKALHFGWSVAHYCVVPQLYCLLIDIQRALFSAIDMQRKLYDYPLPAWPTIQPFDDF